MPAKYQPDLLLLRHVPLNRIHLFTGIQLACLGLLWIIKSTPAAIIFPLMVIQGCVVSWETLSQGGWPRPLQEEDSLLSHLPWLCLVGNPKTEKDRQRGMLTDGLVLGYLIQLLSQPLWADQPHVVIESREN